jgi:hypothetical protein
LILRSREIKLPRLRIERAGARAERGRHRCDKRDIRRAPDRNNSQGAGAPARHVKDLVFGIVNRGVRSLADRNAGARDSCLALRHIRNAVAAYGDHEIVGGIVGEPGGTLAAGKRRAGENRARGDIDGRDFVRAHDVDEQMAVPVRRRELRLAAQRNVADRFHCLGIDQQRIMRVAFHDRHKSGCRIVGNRIGIETRGDGGKNLPALGIEQDRELALAVCAHADTGIPDRNHAMHHRARNESVDHFAGIEIDCHHAISPTDKQPMRRGIDRGVVPAAVRARNRPDHTQIWPSSERRRGHETSHQRQKTGTLRKHRR